MTYACHNRAPFAETYPAIDGYENAWLPHRVEIPFVMSRECEFTKSEQGRVDPKCSGCKHMSTKE